MEKEIINLSGTIEFREFAVDSKSESLRPFLVTEDESSKRLFLEGDNPFENNGLWAYNGKKVCLFGYVGRGGVIIVTDIHEIDSYSDDDEIQDAEIDDSELEDASEEESDDTVCENENKSIIEEEN